MLRNGCAEPVRQIGVALIAVCSRPGPTFLLSTYEVLRSINIAPPPYTAVPAPVIALLCISMRESKCLSEYKAPPPTIRSPLGRCFLSTPSQVAHEANEVNEANEAMDILAMVQVTGTSYTHPAPPASLHFNRGLHVDRENLARLPFYQPLPHRRDLREA